MRKFIRHLLARLLLIPKQYQLICPLSNSGTRQRQNCKNRPCTSPYSVLPLALLALFPAIILPTLKGAGMAEMISASEYDALVDIYNTTGANNLFGWLDPESANWSGVVVAGVEYNNAGEVIKKGYVRRLNLFGQHLTGEIPDGITLLTNLDDLSLGRNQLTGEIPEFIALLTNLKRLNLGKNQLTGEIPDSLALLTNLETLGLNENQLTGEIPDFLSNLNQLEGLGLQGNQLTGEIPNSLGSLTKLTSLSLQNNLLNGKIPDSLYDLTELGSLQLYNNQLTGEISDLIGNLTKISNLELFRNQLSGEIPESIGNLALLFRLNLSGNQLTGSIPESIGLLPQLNFLSLGINQLSGTIPEDIINLSTLKSLDLGQNQLSGEIPENLKLAPLLKSLFLNDNQLSGPIPSTLGQSIGLVDLHLNNNNFTGEVPDSLESLNRLRRLFLQQNQLIINTQEWIQAKETLIGNSATVIDSPQFPPLPTMHRLKEPDLVSNPGEFENPIHILPDIETLREQPQIEGGLVADGVTPLIFRWYNSGASESAYDIVFSNIKGGSIGGSPLKERLFLLEGTEFKKAINDTGIAFEEDQEDTFFYLEGIQADEILLDPGCDELVVHVNIWGKDSVEIIQNFEFRIRKPPVVLVHGYNTLGDWGEPFRRELIKDRPREFVRPISYGVNDGESDVNTFGDLDDLAELLDTVLKQRVEREKDWEVNDPDQEFVDWKENLSGISWKKDWAFSRYDIACHSQGGVLTRMLCSLNPNGRIPAFRSEENFYRGRFHRVVTIGSPHNGSRYLRYLISITQDEYQPLITYGEKLSTDLVDSVPEIKIRAILPYVISRSMVDAKISIGKYTLFEQTGVTQPKFDPFGTQIHELNQKDGKWQPDPRAQFHFIRSKVPDFSPAYFLSIGSPDRVATVLPSGSDGVVDFASQAALPEGSIERGWMTTVPEFIAHSGPTIIHGITESQTASEFTAIKVREAFNGDLFFGPFIVPPLLKYPDPKNPEKPNPIDELGFGPVHVEKIIERLETQDSATQFSALSTFSESEVFSFSIDVPEGFESATPIVWSVENFGPDGITTDGLNLEVDPSDETLVNVEVGPDVIGQVILKIAYRTANDSLVIGDPLEITNRDPADSELLSIELLSDRVDFEIGQALYPNLSGVYSDGKRLPIFVGMFDSIFSTSDPQVVAIEGGPAFRITGPGDATLYAEYRGLTTELAISVASNPAPYPPFAVNIPDPNLLQAIRDTLDIQTGDITDTDLWRLTDLQAAGLGITDLTGLEAAVNLASLDLGENQIGNGLAPLSGLTKLNFLRLARNGISDLNPLSGLTGLTSLYLLGNAISDLSPLSSLSALQELRILANPISDLAPIAGLPNLTTLEIRFSWLELYPGSEQQQIVDTLVSGGIDVTYTPTVNIPDAGLLFAIQEELDLLDRPIRDYEIAGFERLTAVDLEITDLTGLESATSLTNLDLSRNLIDDLGPLAGLTSLTDLRLIGCQVSDLSPLSGLANLSILRLDFNEVVEVNPLAGLQQLTDLDLQGNQIVDLSPFASLTSLPGLGMSVANNQISDISFLSSITGLDGIDLSGNPIADFTPLASAPQLFGLGLSNTGIANLSDLSGLTSLSILFLSDNEISDLSPLAGMIEMLELDLRNNIITDIGPLSGMTKLETLLLEGNLLTDANPASSSTNNIQLFGEDGGTLANEGSVLFPLRSLTLLVELNLSKNQIQDLSALLNLGTLEILDISENQVEDISAISSLISLANLDISNNLVVDIAPVAELDNLQRLSLFENPLDLSEGSAQQALLDQIESSSGADIRLLDPSAIRRTSIQVNASSEQPSSVELAFENEFFDDTKSYSLYVSSDMVTWTLSPPEVKISGIIAIVSADIDPIDSSLFFKVEESESTQSSMRKIQSATKEITK